VKIRITEERECCQPVDLVPLAGGHYQRNYKGIGDYAFCKHCGRHFEPKSFTDGAGSFDWRHAPLKWPWEPREPSPADLIAAAEERARSIAHAIAP
jgi:hypothetical protein